MLTRDTARAVDGFNILNQQFFAADLETEAVQKRLAERLADQVVIQLGELLQPPPARPPPRAEGMPSMAALPASCAIPAPAAWCCCLATMAG